ncbi:MAG: AI-2E family transporter [Minisyncoccota bacterium]
MNITTGSWVRGVLVVAAAALLFYVKDLILVIIASIVIASAVEPAAIWAKKRNFPRLPTILAVYISLALILAGLFFFLFPPLLGEISGFIRSLPDYSSTLATATSSPVSSIFSSVNQTFSIQDIVEQINSLGSSLSKGVFSSVFVIFGGVFSFVLIIVLSFYLAVQEDGVGNFLRVVTPWEREKYIVNLWNRSKIKIGLWMQGQLLLGVIITVLVYLGLLLIGVKHALLLAVLAGILEIIPIFGPILASIPAILLAYTGAGMTQALVVVGLFLVVQQFENHLIYPLVVKKVLGVPPMISILALIIGGQLAGFLGILISVPVAAILMELFSDMEQRKIANTPKTEN